MFINYFSLLAFADESDTPKYSSQLQERVKESKTVPSSFSAWKKTLLWKPYLTIGYSLPIVFHNDFKPSGNIFGNLTTFQNWKIGAGLRVSKYFGIEIAYDSLVTNISMPGKEEDTVLKTNMYAQYMYLAFSAFTPSLNLKYVTLEMAVSAGIAGVFGVTNVVQTIKSDGTASSPQIIYGQGSPEFFGGVSIILGFAKVVSLRAFAEVVTMNHALYDINVVMKCGLAVNVYLL